MKTVCVFCGSQKGRNPRYQEKAEELGRELAKRKVTLIYGGTRIGLMGVIADSVLSNGGEVIGVMADTLSHLEIAHKGITSLYQTRSLGERKAKMIELADGFISLPGGTGTLDEYFEILCSAQVGEHVKPSALFNIEHYFDPLLELLFHMEKEEFIRGNIQDYILSSDNPQTLLDKMGY